MQKVSAASKQNQAADSGLCNIAQHINRLRRKNRARFLQLNVQSRRRERELKEEKKKNHFEVICNFVYLFTQQTLDILDATCMIL